MPEEDNLEFMSLFSGVKIYCCFQGISDETGPKLPKFIILHEKGVQFPKEFLYINMAAVT